MKVLRERLQPVPILFLTVVWVCLWGDLSALPSLILSGLIFSMLVLLVFPLPRLTLGLRPNPIALLWLLVKFLADVLVASVQVAWLTIRPGPAATGELLAVELHSDSDFIRTSVAEMTALVPGSVIVDLTGRRMVVHAIDVHGEEEKEQVRARILATEQRVLKAFRPEGER